jgi:hypothetical protein
MDRHLSGHLAHRRQDRMTALLVLDDLVADDRRLELAQPLHIFPRRHG